ncbi:GtrA family protein [Agromyces badenianii]|uniref:GtrA family protein n=1 Tax=Agromyces badenianii TaxID=2080742 RepID=A0A2S0WX64_9MICO|nr:GtrA family protein [Agromyces badenianii]AWB95901.1 GtrA family protein [Agromyces badenianii]
MPGILRNSAIRYLIAGGAAFVVDFALLALFRQVFGWPTWIAAGTAFVLSFAFTYTVQRVFSFESDTPHGRSLLRYTALVVFNTAATAGIVALVDLTDAGWGLGKVVATIATTVWNYFIYRYWVFAEPKVAEPTRTED